MSKGLNPSKAIKKVGRRTKKHTVKLSKNINGFKTHESKYK